MSVMTLGHVDGESSLAGVARHRHQVRRGRYRSPQDALLVATAAGDVLAFEKLFRDVVPQVLGVCQRVIRDATLAEEVSQEVMVEVWRKAGNFDPERGTANGWILTLARRRAIDRVRSEQAGRDRDDRVARRDAVREFDEVAATVETRLEHRQVRQALARLTPRQREAVELAYFQSHTYREVADLLEIPEGTAKSRLRDALRGLHNSLAETL